MDANFSLSMTVRFEIQMKFRRNSERKFEIEIRNSQCSHELCTKREMPHTRCPNRTGEIRRRVGWGGGSESENFWENFDELLSNFDEFLSNHTNRIWKVAKISNCFERCSLRTVQVTSDWICFRWCSRALFRYTKRAQTTYSGHFWRKNELEASSASSGPAKWWCICATIRTARWSRSVYSVCVCVCIFRTVRRALLQCSPETINTHTQLTVHCTVYSLNSMMKIVRTLRVCCTHLRLFGEQNAAQATLSKWLSSAKLRPPLGLVAGCSIWIRADSPSDGGWGDRYRVRIAAMVRRIAG